MNVFEVHRRIIDDYARRMQSFIRIEDDETRKTVDEELARGKLWPESLLQFNLAFKSAVKVARSSAGPRLTLRPPKLRIRSRTPSAQEPDMNLIEMDIDDSFDFYCPKTGKMILGPDFFEVSDATAFCFSPEAGDFDSIADEYQPLWQKIEEQYGEEEFGDELFKRFCDALLKEHPNLVIFGFTSHGIACGPVSNTIYVCIDFAYGCDDGEE